ncbi:GCN5 family acetyltransferase (plasmid) [Arthrobacter sp. ERGS1:01]|uniref:GNAT family N-acetyltransferase n=1 Tax=Arthrobacter sp. ERGS1:01 TaxID=1704044 RepID=UPI0006B63147|nr:GNAT family N-acetyltransferase [Arthrobacter sp. ERGS1:01]ALE04334.1 GCN5 family acetyltransferase [Arthrobacter sp. ERGS1:01]
MRISLRPATVDDAEAVAHLHLRCHEEAYGRHLPPEFFIERRASLPARMESMREAIAKGHVPTLAYDDDGLLGIANAGPARDDDAPAEVELFMIYTLERAYGSGAGQMLLDAAIGTQAAFLWVLEDNPRAQAFYAKNGFAFDGTRKLLPESWHSLPEVRMVRSAVAG